VSLFITFPFSSLNQCKYHCYQYPSTPQNPQTLGHVSLRCYHSNNAFILPIVCIFIIISGSCVIIKCKIYNMQNLKCSFKMLLRCVMLSDAMRTQSKFTIKWICNPSTPSRPHHFSPADLSPHALDTSCVLYIYHDD
jgi:hypothetical protein